MSLRIDVSPKAPPGSAAWRQCVTVGRGWQGTIESHLQAVAGTGWLHHGCVLNPRAACRYPCASAAAGRDRPPSTATRAPHVHRQRQLHLGAFMRPVSIHTSAWRYPGSYPDANFNFQHYVRFIQTWSAAASMPSSWPITWRC
jgi:hypothetical protein